MISTAVIIVAGGRGNRMGKDVPKQFLEVCGKPILMYTIEKCVKVLPDARIIVVLPSDQIEYWKNLCEKHSFYIKHIIEQGGSTRFKSVQNGLFHVAGCDMVGVHDGVRPFINETVVLSTLADAEEFGAAIPVVEITDSLREITTSGSSIVDRSRLRAIQTPQFFRTKILTSAYEVEYDPMFTDDASVVESAGNTVFLSKGNPQNIKITTEFDLLLAESIIENENK